jgi:hypothetical protein
MNNILKKSLLFFLALSILLLLLMFSPFGISNDGRHYLSAAEALKESGVYASLGRSASGVDLYFLHAWPPVYSALIAVVAFLLDIPVTCSVRLIMVLIFFLTALLIWKNFKDSVPIWGILGMLLYIINSGHYYSTNAEIFLVPALLFLYWKKDFFITYPFTLGLLAGALYLTKYSFSFIIPTFFLYLLVNTKGIDIIKINLMKNSGIILRKIFFYLLGFLSLYCVWHYIVYENSKLLYSHFSNPVRETLWYQYFRDFIITWNIFPERFENIALYPGVVFFIAVAVFIFYDIVRKVQIAKKITLNQFFWHIPLLGMLALFLLVAIIGTSTKRYLEFSDFFFFVILCTTLPVIEWNKAYRYLAIGLVLIQALYFLRINLPKISTLSVENMYENPLYRDINKQFAEGEIEKLYVVDLSFAGAVINYEFWNKLERLSPDSGNALSGEKIFFMLQEQDLEKIKFELPKENIFYINR